MKVAASPQSINRAMPEGGIQVTSHQSLVTPNPQSLATHPCFQTCGGGIAASIYGGRCPKVSRFGIPNIDRLTAKDKDFSLRSK